MRVLAAVLAPLLLASHASAFAPGAAHLGLRSGASRMSCSVRPQAAARVAAGGVSMKLQNDLMVRVARGEECERTPIWLFRQAGRHLPEYTQYKKDTGCNFLELLKVPKHVAECTMQPVRRYDLDAAILFSDILVVAEALGIDVEMPGGKGILVPNPLTGPEDFQARIPKTIDVKDKLSHVLEAVKLIKVELKDKVPLIGFSAAPWTLMYYMVGGSSKKNQEEGERWLKEHPKEAQELLDILTTVVVDYMSAQADAGADILQVFEAMGMFISKESFYKYAMPCMVSIAKQLHERHPTVPLMAFPRGATYALADLQQAGYDVVTMDTQTERAPTRVALANAAQAATPPNLSKGVSSLQGNFDVALLKKGEGTVEEVDAAARKMLEELGASHLIANLGEGLMGVEDPVLVNALVESIHKISDEMLAKK